MACSNCQRLSVVSAELTGVGGDRLLRLGENPMGQGLLTEKARRPGGASRPAAPTPAPPR